MLEVGLSKPAAPAVLVRRGGAGRSMIGVRVRALVLFGAGLLGASIVASPHVAAGDPPHAAKATAPAAKPAPKSAAPAASTKTTAPKTASRGPTPKRAATTAPVAASRVWHTATPGRTAPVDASGRPMLVLQGLNIPDRVELTALTDHGGFSAEDLDRASHILREPSSGNEHPMEPMLLDLVYRLQTHFNAHEIRIISGYRTPRHGTTSNHGKGRAMDIVVPGASDEDVAKFAREEGFCGVGIYPVSGFVHVDVRERSFFWVDTSGPGKRNRTRGILSDLAARSDARASARGQHPIGPFVIGSDVDATLGRAEDPSQGATGPEDDDDLGDSLTD